MPLRYVRESIVNSVAINAFLHARGNCGLQATQAIVGEMQLGIEKIPPQILCFKARDGKEHKIDH